MRSFQKANLRRHLHHFLLKNWDRNFTKSKLFILFSVEVANLYFSLSAWHNFASRPSRFLVLLAGSCYPSSFPSESALNRLSDECLIRRLGTSSSFSSYCTVEISLHVFPLNIAPAKISTLPNVVFISGKGNTPNFGLRSGNINQLVVNLE